MIYQPVSSGKISQTDIIEFAKYYNDLPKPILMICRSGSRSSALFHRQNLKVCCMNKVLLVVMCVLALSACSSMQSTPNGGV